MQRDRRVRIYDAHSWTGITLGIFLFVVCFTGSLALFDHEIQTWEDPARRLVPATEVTPVHPLFESWIAELPAGEITFVGLFYPSDAEPYYQGLVNFRAEGDDEPLQFLRKQWDPQTGTELPARSDGLSTWLLDFHRDLMWPDFLGGRQIGRGLVGIAGVIMLLSILTGILTHRKILKEAFTFRRKKSVRVKWKDAHNFIGIWSLPFSTVIAFTGAWLGIVALLLPITGLLVFKGDTEAVAATVVGEPSARAGTPAEMLSLDVVANRGHSDSGALPAFVSIQNWGDVNAEYLVQYKPDTELMTYEAERISGVTGERLALTGLLQPSASTRVLAAITPLHYGTYGGILLKFLYFALGISLSAMVALGNMVWIERRANSSEGSKSPEYYARLARFTAGACLGVVVASPAIFYADLLYAGDEAGRIVAVGQTYFAVWFAVLLVAMFLKNTYQTVRALLGITGISLVALPIFAAVVHGQMPWTLVAKGHFASPSVDLTLLVLGVSCLLVAHWLPKARNSRLRSKRSTAELPTNASAVPGG
ncbi:MAG: PepSY-associated TM helix domain-containing protein [Pseudomonadota bacterium]